MYKYKVYFHDRDMKIDYPVMISKEDICELCEWMNKHTVRWNLEVLEAQLIDSLNNFISPVALLPTELDIQHFITSLPKRLIAYSEFVNGGV